jgi:hypothetical protein
MLIIIFLSPICILQIKINNGIKLKIYVIKKFILEFIKNKSLIIKKPKKYPVQEIEL